ncbi:MAG: 4Fe-4S ferredoxin [Deltaproteobacteria bacterium]|nr:4Fe-4S ferredoxin [Candidatus Tharpella sp.]
MNSNELRTMAEKTVQRIVNYSLENNLKGFNEKSWDSPIVGFAAGNDPIFKSYKKLIGKFHWTPAEVMQIAYPEIAFDENDLSVICWILPQTENTLADQRRENKLPSSRWVYSRHYGEKFNDYLRATVRNTFTDAGIKTAAPAITKGFGYRESDNAGLASNWSERHAAFVAGLGTFGLSDGFISEKGKAVRIGSVIINARIKPDQRKYNSHTANCLWHAEGTCGACMKRCPANAISAEGHDKKACFNYIKTVSAPYAEKILGTYETPCGLCQVKIPCERRNPTNVKTP